MRHSLNSHHSRLSSNLTHHSKYLNLLTQQQQNFYSNQISFLIQQFLTLKKNILDEIIFYNNTNKIIDICQMKIFQKKINKIKDINAFMEKYMNENVIKRKQKQKKQTNKNTNNLIRLNQHVYESFIHINEYMKCFFQQINNLLNQQQKQQQKNKFQNQHQNQSQAYMITKRHHHDNNSQNIIQFISPYAGIKNNKTQRQNSTNHMTKNKSKSNLNSKRTNYEKKNYVNSWQQYVIDKKDTQYNNQQQQQSQSQSQQMSQNNDSLDNNQISYIQSQQSSLIKLNLNPLTPSQLNQFFLSFLLSFSATNQQYNLFIQNLLKQITFDRQYFGISAQYQIQQKMQSDNFYMMEILSGLLMKKCDKLKRNDEKNQQEFKKSCVCYLSNDQMFVQITIEFIKVNVQQLIQKVKQFQSKAIKINEIYTKLNQLNIQPSNQYLINTLSKYLPQQYLQHDINHKQFTFSPRTLNKNQNPQQLQQLNNLYTNQHTLLASLSIFQKTLLKISFTRILHCKRFNLKSILKIFNCLNKSKSSIKNVMRNCFVYFKQYNQIIQEMEKKQEKILETIKMKKIKQIVKEWKNVKLRKIKLLKILLRKNAKIMHKQQILIFNRWRINVSRKRIQQKMLAHSNSCNILFTKFSDQQIQYIQLKKSKQKQYLNKSHYKSSSKIFDQKSISSITLNKQSSSKNFIQSKQSYEYNKKLQHQKYQKPKYRQNTENIKLLNMKYKLQIVNRLKKESINKRTTILS